MFIEDEELRNLYKISGEENLQKLTDGLLHLQKHPDDEATLEELLRVSHILKGDSRIVGVEDVVTLTTQIEKILLSLKRQNTIFTSHVSDCLYQGLDAIGFLVYEAVTGELVGVDIAEILDRLTAAVLESKPQELEVVPQAQPDISSQESVARDNQYTTITNQYKDVSGHVCATINSNSSVLTSSFIEDADIEDAELRVIYQTASEEHLQNLAAGLLHLQNQPEDEATLEQLLREAHSLKGDSRNIGVENVVTLTHQLEEILLSIKRQEIILTPQLCDRLYQALDTIALLVQEAVIGQPSEVDASLVVNNLMAAISASTIQESLPVSPKVPSLPAKIPIKAATDDLLSPSLGVSQPYQIDTIRVQTRYLDALMTQVEELTVTKIAIAHAATEIEEMASLWEEWKAVDSQEQYLDSSSLDTNSYAERLEKTINSLRTSIQEHSTKLDIINGELKEKIRTVRLLPLSTVFKLLRRTVQDLARQQSKEVELIIAGEEITADKRILEEIKDPLMHMVRNAIDHGIETPSEREKLGKPPVATIWLRAYQTATNITIEVTDDGRGLDIEKIKQTAVKRELYSPEELTSMTPSQIHDLILAPGFSTQTFITEISGRGIGLDVVRTSVERLKGNIQIESTPGQGCTFRIDLSTTLAIANVLLFEVQGIVHALPIEFVQKTLLISPEQIITNEDRTTINLDGQAVLVANLADLLELSNSPGYDRIAKFEQLPSSLQPCILLKVGEEQFGFFVDRLLNTQEVVIKPHSQLLKRVHNITGVTILGSGEVCIILNPSYLLKSLQQQTMPTVSVKPRKTVKRKPLILLVEDSTPVRTQEKRLLEKAGYEVVVAVDGLDGYNKLKTHDFNAIVSDVEMPNLDGFSLTAKIRQHPEYQALPIILVTTLVDNENKRRGSDAGANAYIMKSNFNQDVLLEILERLV
ncbi:hybrid sensor histidine kinase/response regulator [Fischerella sp. PCC 9605]|uniref:hybrid sensor histidine kinase/response regulator n=1 Tax=Fischerella sp. PCC 9605 TaxID=1173024 RepID=UPI00047BB2D0|nr:hybrid sensor histidine kinase/response regulator [Fischerella sp. PCC 9605]